MSESHGVERLNLADLDVEDLERRLELVEPGTSEDYYCGSNNCTTNTVVEQPPDQDVAY